MNRNIEEVLNTIVDKLTTQTSVPKEDTEDTINELTKVINGASYSAPELMYLHWNKAYYILIDYFFDETTKLIKTDREDLGVQVFSIFSTKPEDDIRRECTQVRSE